MATYKVKTGDSFWRIAANVLGDGGRFQEIIQANNVTTLQPGMTINVPGQERGSRDWDGRRENNWDNPQTNNYQENNYGVGNDRKSNYNVGSRPGDGPTEDVDYNPPKGSFKDAPLPKVDTPGFLRNLARYFRPVYQSGDYINKIVNNALGINTLESTSGKGEYSAQDMFPDHPLDEMDNKLKHEMLNNPRIREQKLREVREWENQVYGGKRQNPMQAYDARYLQDSRFDWSQVSEYERARAYEEMYAWTMEFGPHPIEDEKDLYQAEQIGIFEPDESEDFDLDDYLGGGGGWGGGGGGYPAGYGYSRSAARGRPSNVRSFALSQWRI